MIAVKIEQLMLSNMGFVVVLKGIEDERSLPIFIGGAEAQAIAIKMEGVEIPRPLTHDLLKNLLDSLDCRLVKVEVCDLTDGTFYARLVLERDGAPLEIDCRPSDAIALAVRASVPIYVAESVMNEAGRVMNQGQEEAGGEKKEPPAPKSELDVLNLKLERAVEQERYEDAAKIRDEIKRLKGAHN